MSSSPGPVAPRTARTFWVSSLPRPSTLENLNSTLTLLGNRNSAVRGLKQQSVALRNTFIPLTSSTLLLDTTGSETQRPQTGSRWTAQLQACSTEWDLRGGKPVRDKVRSCRQKTFGGNFFSEVISCLLKHLHIKSLGSVTLCAQCFLKPLLGEMFDGKAGEIGCRPRQANELFMWIWVLGLCY